MTTIVPTSEEDPALSVVRFAAELSWADAGPEVTPTCLYILIRNSSDSFPRFMQKFQLKTPVLQFFGNNIWDVEN